MADGPVFEAWTTTEVRVGCEGCAFGGTVEKPGLKGTVAVIACINTGSLGDRGIPVSVEQRAETRTLVGESVVGSQLVSSSKDGFNGARAALCASGCQNPTMAHDTLAAVNRALGV
jgi:hypothetical protein